MDAWTTTQVVQLSLHDATLEHFKNHTTHVPMDTGFQMLASMMEEADRAVDQPTNDEDMTDEEMNRFFDFDAAQRDYEAALARGNAGSETDVGYEVDVCESTSETFTVTADPGLIPGFNLGHLIKVAEHADVSEDTSE